VLARAKYRQHFFIFSCCCCCFCSCWCCYYVLVFYISVSVVTRLHNGWTGIVVLFPTARQNLTFFETSRPALGPTQPPIRGVSGVLPPPVKWLERGTVCVRSMVPSSHRDGLILFGKQACTTNWTWYWNDDEADVGGTYGSEGRNLSGTVTVRGSNPSGGKGCSLLSVLTRPGAHPTSCVVGTAVVSHR
jgi:hypothetical protein